MCQHVYIFFNLLIELWCSGVYYGVVVMPKKLKTYINTSVSGSVCGECQKVHVLFYTACARTYDCFWIFRLKYGVVGCLFDGSDDEKIENNYYPLGQWELLWRVQQGVCFIIWHVLGRIIFLIFPLNYGVVGCLLDGIDAEKIVFFYPPSVIGRCIII